MGYILFDLEFVNLCICVELEIMNLFERIL
jgi:hypothetical protein